MSAETKARELLGLADIEVGGDRPSDIQVHNPDFYARVLGQGALGLGESYMEPYDEVRPDGTKQHWSGWWDAAEPDAFLAKVLDAELQKKVRPSPSLLWLAGKSIVMNNQTRFRSSKNARHHYDIGNELYERMLDSETMAYTCAYWGKDADGEEPQTLGEAQRTKFDLICRKLHLEPGMSILDIGCGWGGFVQYAAENYGVAATGITPAAEQVSLGRERTAHLPDVTIEQQVYQDLEPAMYDRVVSIGSLEHVGPKNYSQFYRIQKDHLKPGGLVMNHHIGGNRRAYNVNAWLDKYIFPGGVIPAYSQVVRPGEGLLTLKDTQNFGTYYDRTCMTWDANFREGYDELSDMRPDVYDERFYRMWRFYLLGSAAGFRSGHLQLVQTVWSHESDAQLYDGVRF